MTDRQLQDLNDSFDEVGAIRLPEFLFEPGRAMRRRWPWMLLVLLLGLAATVAITALIKPRYFASAVVLVSAQQIPEEFVRPTVEDDSLQRISAMVGDILSNTRLTELVEKYDLYAEDGDSLQMSEIVANMRDDVVIERLRDLPTDRRQESASRYSISFTADDPVIAANVANDLAASFTQSNTTMRRRQAQLTTDFLRRELASSESQLRKVEREIREFNERYRGELPDELPANLHKIEQLQRQRQSLAMQSAEAETRIAMLRASGNERSPEAQLAALKSDLAREIAVNTEEHPNAKSLRRQVAALEEQIRTSGGEGDGAYTSRSALIAAEQRSMEEIRRQQAETERELREIDARVSNTPKRQEEFNALQEKVSVLRADYREFLRKVQEAELAQNLESAQQGERVMVLDEAVPPRLPTRARGRYLLAGVVTSLALSVAVGGLLEFFDAVIVSAHHVEAAFGLPVLGSVYRIS